MLFSLFNSCSPLQPTLRRAGEQELGCASRLSLEIGRSIEQVAPLPSTSWMNKIFVRPLWKHNYWLRGIEKRGSRGEAKLVTNCRCFSADTFVIRGNVLSIDAGVGKFTRRKSGGAKLSCNFTPIAKTFSAEGQPRFMSQLSCFIIASWMWNSI